MTALIQWLLVKHSVALIPVVMFLSYVTTSLVEDWNARLIVMFGVGGIAGIILAIARLKVANATARKIDADTVTSQFILIIERLQEEGKRLSQRVEAAQRKEDVITFSKHEALKYNEAANLFVLNAREIVAKHNAINPACAVELPPLTFIPLADILRVEDEARLKSATIAGSVTA